MSEIRFNGICTNCINDLSFTIKDNSITAISGDVSVTDISNLLIGSSTINDGNIEIFKYILNKDNYKKLSKKIQKKCVCVIDNTKKYLQNKNVKNEFIFNYKFIDKRYNENEVVKYLNMLELSKEVLTINPQLLSSVEQKKIVLASMLIMNPEIIIFDNIDKCLDLKDQQLIKRIIFDLKRQNKTIIIITNNTNFYCNIVDRVLIINNNTIIADGDKKIFFEYNNLPIDEPDIVSFIKKFNNKNNEKLYQTYEFNDLLKDIYRIKSDIQR